MLLIALLIQTALTTLPQCMDIGNSLCIAGDTFTPKVSSKDAVLSLDFDTFPITDFNQVVKGSQNVLLGPTPSGQGWSASLEKDTQMEFPLDSTSFTQMSLSFWVFLRKGETQTWRNIVHTGASVQENAPTLKLWPSDNRLHLKVSTKSNWAENLDSIGELTLRTWSHVTVVVTARSSSIYLNGILDAKKTLTDGLLFNKGPLHLGRDPWDQGIVAYLDTFRYFSYALDGKVSCLFLDSAIMAISLGNNHVFPSFTARLGCLSCKFEEALQRCPVNYHLCSLLELNSGAFTIARKNGWLRYGNAHMWYYDPSVQETTSAGNLGMGICCVDRINY